MIRYIDQLNQDALRDKKVLLRVDFNVAREGGSITEPFRIQRTKKTIDYLLHAGARVALISHLEGDHSFESLVDHIAMILGREVFFEKSPDYAKALDAHALVLFDNVRLQKGEKENDDAFAKQLAKDFDYYVNDAFAVSHREHASVVAVTDHLDSYAGFLMQEEIHELEKVLKEPSHNKTLVIAGAKVSTKLPVIKNFLNRADHILVGGVLANVLLKQKGIPIGASITEDIAVDFDVESLQLPQDFVVSADTTGNQPQQILDISEKVPQDQMILDIGPKTIAHFVDIMSQSSMVIWNGSVGFNEVVAFAEGTRRVAEAIAKVPRSIIGGGDTIAAVHDMLDRFSFVSTGGGAMLRFLAGKEMPGLKALGFYEI